MLSFLNRREWAEGGDASGVWDLCLLSFSIRSILPEFSRNINKRERVHINTQISFKKLGSMNHCSFNQNIHHLGCVDSYIFIMDTDIIQLIKAKKPYLVAIAGGPGSGKTTLSSKIQQ